MTSTYRALFLGFFAPLRGPAALNRSSILLELLRLVVGRLGALAVLVLDTERIIGGAPSDGGAWRLPTEGEGLRVGPGGGVMVDRGGPAGGALARPASGLDVGAVGSAELELTDRGGGGVAFLASWSFGSAFLLTHRFCSGS